MLHVGAVDGGIDARERNKNGVLQIKQYKRMFNRRKVAVLCNDVYITCQTTN